MEHDMCPKINAIPGVTAYMCMLDISRKILLKAKHFWECLIEIN